MRAFAVLLVAAGCSRPPVRVEAPTAATAASSPPGCVLEPGWRAAPADRWADIVARLEAMPGCHTFDHLDALAQSWHVRASKAMDHPSFRLIDRVYDLALASAPDTEPVAMARYAHGELLWQLALDGDQPALWAKAAAAFDVVAGTTRLPDPARREAGYAAVLAWVNALGLHAPLPTLRARPQTIGGDSVRALAAFERFAARADTDGTDRASVTYQIARVHARHGHLEVAVRMLEDLLRSQPDPELALLADELLRLAMTALAAGP